MGGCKHRNLTLGQGVLGTGAMMHSLARVGITAVTLVTKASMVQQWGWYLRVHTLLISKRGAAGEAGADGSGGTEGGAAPMDVDDGARVGPAPPAVDAAPAAAAGAARIIT